jgi:hypothetical protein
MEAIKQIIRVKDEKITIHLNPEMNNMKVEVIILPILPKKNNKNNLEKGIKELESVSIWSNNEIKAIEDSSKKLNQWTIQNF